MADSPASPPSRDADSRWLFALLIAILGFAGWMLTRSWHASILDRYEFRQIQTALSIYWMKQEGLRLDYLTPLFGPPWIVPLEFPVYQWIVAIASNLTGMELEQTGRLVGILFYAAMLPAVYGLTALADLSASRRWLVLAVVVLTPVYLFYPRTVLIESTALCFAVWFLYAMHRLLAGYSHRWLAAACIFASLAALTKITTFVIYAALAGWLTLAVLRRRAWTGERRFRPDLAIRPALSAAFPVALALGAALWWIAHGDAIKYSNPLTHFLASRELHQWNYGAFGLRFDPSFWMRLVKNITENLLSEGAFALSLVAATFARPAARHVALACFVCFFTGPLIFANLYHFHDYYYCANALLLTGGAGILIASAWDNPRVTRAARWVLLSVFLLFQYVAFDRGYHYYYWKAAPPPPALATIMRETIPADDVVLVSGIDWDPLYAYYSQRRAIMVAAGRDGETAVVDEVVGRLPPRRVGGMVLVGYTRQMTDMIRSRVERFGFAPQPFASNATADLYLPADVIPAATARLSHRLFPDTQIHFQADAGLTMPTAVEQRLPAKDFPTCSPAPVRSRSQFGISAGTIDGKPVIFTHAPSELHFSPPAGARRISATVGLIAAAWAEPLPKASDGIVVEIFEKQANGLLHSLFRRELDPVSRQQDRIPQEINFERAEPFADELVFVISPGAANNASYDQAYWSRIEIR